MTTKNPILFEFATLAIVDLILEIHAYCVSPSSITNHITLHWKNLKDTSATVTGIV
jgi:hypothetical protein